MPVLGSGLPGGPGPDRDTSGRDGRNESLLGLSAKRPSSQDISASLNKKRKAGSVEETKEIYNTTHTCSPIKQEPGKPEGDPCNSGGITEPDDVSIKQEPSTKDVPQVPDNDNGEREEESSSHSSRLGDFLPMSDEEADSPDHDSRKPSDVEGRMNSSSLLWDVSESESDTSEPEEGSSYGESIRSAFSLGVERLGTREPNASFRGPQDFHSEESDNIRGRRGTSQDQSGISRKRPRNMATNESNGTEEDAPRRSVLHLHDSHARGGSSETPNDRMTKSNNETTTTGKPRQRAPAKSHVSAHSIPRSWKTATPADKMLMKMKDRGSGWLEIRKAWQELTGQWPAASTLPNRYNRIKDNLTHLKSGDVRIFLSEHWLLLRCNKCTCLDTGSLVAEEPQLCYTFMWKFLCRLFAY